MPICKASPEMFILSMATVSIHVSVGKGPADLTLDGRQLGTRDWRTIRSDCDLAGGTFTPDADNCDTFFGSTKIACE